MKDVIRPLYLFWFCVFVFTVSFAAMMMLLFSEIPDKNREMASNAQGFLQGSLIMSAVGFLLTGNINTNTKKIGSTPTAEINANEINATITSSPDEQTNNA